MRVTEVLPRDQVWQLTAKRTLSLSSSVATSLMNASRASASAAPLAGAASPFVGAEAVACSATCCEAWPQPLCSWLLICQRNLFITSSFHDPPASASGD